MDYLIDSLLLADGRSLLPQALRPLPLGGVMPAGWLRGQLQFQAAGLSGHLDEFWPSIKDSAWVGGKNEGWERGPYWLDGLIPLAFLIDSAPLKHKARRWVDYILAHQREDGWLGPVLKKKDGSDLYDTWPLYPLLKALTQWQEATGDTRVIPAMQKLLRRVDQQISKEPIFEWGHFRTADFVVSIQWLYDRTREPWLLELAAKVRAQSFDWAKLFAGDFPHKGKTPGTERGSKSTHGVNIAMGIKQPGVWYRQTHEPADREAAQRMMAVLDEFHGQATGVFSCDEHLAGRMPSHGTELCTVVEYMYSLEVLLAVLGRAELADRLEKLAFNALPAAFKPDYWAKQYDQQANQVVCKISEDRVYTDNGPDANLYGLEPHFGCCTANFSQGWPKFASHLWKATPDGGLAAVVYAPCTVRTSAGGAAVTLRVETDYPFGEEIRIRIDGERPAAFPILLRVPAWADGATVQVDDAAVAQAKPGGFHRVEGTWKSGSSLTLRLPMKFRTQRRFNDSITIERGPLVFSLNVPGEWRRVRGNLPYADWEVHPKAEWNYALAIDPQRPEDSIRFESRGVGEQPFSPEGAPVRAKAPGKKVSSWNLEKNAAAPPPPSPVAAEGPTVEVELVPYASAKLRVTEFPLAR